MSNIYDEFKNPGASYRGKPFWSWNGDLKKEELLRQIDVMKDMGFGGYFMHSRTGLVTKYLGKEWFELINAVADRGTEIGMENWLYDEDRWPSGTAGGFVTMNPDFSIKYIRLEMKDGSDFSFDRNYLIVFSCDMLPSHEFAFANDVEITRDTPPCEYNKKKILAFSIEPMANSSFYNGYTYVDTMNKEAIDKFIELTHEKYKENCKERIGTTISGIFTDEPHRGSVMCGFSIDNRDPYFLTPYTGKLFENFQHEFGYDLKKRLPDLFLLRNGEMVSQVKWHYMNLIEDMFIKCYADPINDWCNNNNMLLTGHVLHEDSLTTQVCMNGSLMRFYEHMGNPGVDVLTEDNRNYWVVKQLSSVGRQTGKKTLLSELYGCTGWQMDFESHKWIGAWQALFGINLRCHHLSWYAMAGEAKRDYPASILHQSAWYKDYKLVEDYFSRLHVVLNEEPICDTLVMNPVESPMAMIYPGWSHQLGTNHPEVARLEGMYCTQFHWLAQSQIDFDYGDEEMMSRLAEVVIEDGVPFVKFGLMKYKKVVISGMDLIRKSTIDILEKFIAVGGKVIIAGDAPEYVDAQKSDAAKLFANKCIRVPFEKDALVAELLKISPKLVSVENACEDEMPEIFCQVRKSGEDYFVVLMNMSKETTFFDCKISIALDGDCEEWSACDASKHLIAKSNNGKIEIVTDIAAADERIYCIKAKSNLDAAQKYKKVAKYPLPEEYNIELSEPNVLVCDIVKYEIDGKKCNEYTEILKADMAIRDNYGLAHRGGEMIQPWFLGLQEQKKHGKIALEYELFAEYIPSTFDFVCEAPELWDIYINGQKVSLDKKTGNWVDISFEKFTLDGSMLKNGQNIIRMEADFYETLNLEAVYILGDFCVRLDNFNKTITAPKTRIVHGDICEKGFPFYSGEITYKAVVHKGATDRIIISLPDFEGALVKISANGKEPIAIAWQPYEADITDILNDGNNEIGITYVLTRRNTFGPLHALPARYAAYGPGNFTTGGEAFTNNYVFVPAAMTAVPQIIVKR